MSVSSGPMRYLYGDSTPFPLGYNFLTTLEAFMAAATRIVQLDLEGQQIVKQRDEAAQNRLKGFEALEQFHNVVMRAVQDTAQKVQHQHALEYARHVAEYATRYIEEHRKTTFGSNERESVQLRSDGDRRAIEMRAQLEAFLKMARFPVLKTKLSIRLNVDGKDVRHGARAPRRDRDLVHGRASPHVGLGLPAQGLRLRRRDRSPRRRREELAARDRHGQGPQRRRLDDHSGRHERRFVRAHAEA
jgi:hypothetical protein